MDPLSSPELDQERLAEIRHRIKQQELNIASGELRIAQIAKEHKQCQTNISAAKESAQRFEEDLKKLEAEILEKNSRGIDNV